MWFMSEEMLLLFLELRREKKALTKLSRIVHNPLHCFVKITVHYIYMRVFLLQFFNGFFETIVVIIVQVIVAL
jgi:hypothetical protein